MSLTATIYALNDTKSLLYNLIQTIDNGQGCTLIELSDNMSLLSYLAKDKPVVSVKWTSNLNIVEMVASLMRKNVFCAISLIHGQANDSESLQDFILSTTVIDNHNSIYLNRIRPEIEQLTDIIRPFIWVDKDEKITQKNHDKFEVYCPKMGKPKKPALNTFMFHNNMLYNIKSKTPGTVGVTCHNPLGGQLITMAGLPIRPQFHFPNTVGNEKMSGFAFNMFMLYASHFGFETKLFFRGGGTYVPQNRTFTPGAFSAVMSGEADLSIAAIVPVLILFDMGASLRLTNVRYMTRMPKPIVTYDKVVRPFPLDVWIMFVFITSCMAVVIYAIHRVHSSDGIREHRLVKEEKLTLNLFLFPITKIVEPDALPWFEKWSSGKLVYLLWMIFCTFIVAFYTSNLRAHLVYIDYEKAPQDLKDIYERGERVYVYSNAARLRKAYLERHGQTHTYKYKIAELAEATGGIYNLNDHGGLHRGIPEDMGTNGAFALIEDYAIPFYHMRYPDWRMENIHVVPEVALFYYTSFIFKKFSPGTKLLNEMAATIVEAGILNYWTTQHLSARSLLHYKSPQVELGSLGQPSFYGPYFMYSFGLLASSMAFALEINRKKSINLQLTYKKHVW